MTLLIQNAEIYNGGGGKPFSGNIFVSGEKISAIGNIPARHAKIILDCQGIKVCPGFIDSFAKTDHYGGILDEPEQKEFLKNGITTVIGGGEGISLAPLNKDNLHLIEEWSGRYRNLAWNSMAEFLTVLSRRRLGVNFGTLVGYETLRWAVAPRRKTLGREELNIIQQMLRTAKEEGGLDVSYAEENKNIAITAPTARKIVPGRLFLPPPLKFKKPAELMEALTDEWLQSKIVPQIENFDANQLVVVQAPTHDPLVGNSLRELGDIFQIRDPKQMLWKLLSLTRGQVLLALPPPATKEWPTQILTSRALIGTAGASFNSTRRPRIILADENPSALRRFIVAVTANKLMPLSQIIHRLTALPAQTLGLQDRGELKEGKFADIVGFTEDSANGEINIKWVIVNGRLAMREGEFVDAAGKVLTPP